MVLVHGSWVDHHEWDPVISELSETFRVLIYDRRGHSKSERPEKQGNTEEDVSDLIALIEELGMAPAHLVGNSFGAALALKIAGRRPDLIRTLNIHEPPLFGLISQVPEAQPFVQIVNERIQAVAELIARGENENAAQQFVETIAIGPGSWQKLPPAVQQTFIFNAPTFYDELLDPGALQMDTSTLTSFRKPVLFTNGSETPPFFLLVLNQLARVMPEARRKVFNGSGHVPHISDPAGFIKTVKDFCLGQVEAVDA